MRNMKLLESLCVVLGKSADIFQFRSFRRQHDLRPITAEELTQPHGNGGFERFGLTEKLEERLGIILYSTRGESLEAVVGQRLRLKQYTIATAESCTGGLQAQRITEISGSSDYFAGGVVSYTNEAKIQWLGVQREAIDRHGPVSGEVAEEMAMGVRDMAGASIGVSVTGIAGPGGGSDAVPVGTVYIGLANESGAMHKRVILPGDRHLVRWRASTSALELVRRNYLV